MEENQPTLATPSTPPIAKLATALAKAQGKFPVIPKDSEVEVKSKEGKFLYKYKYADLTTIIAATRPAMAEHGLSFTQGIVEGGFATLIMHESGEKLETGFVPFELPRGGDMKTIAGLVTYVKRISLTAALGVSADEDVDAAHDEAKAGNTTGKESIGGRERTQGPAPRQNVPQESKGGGAQEPPYGTPEQLTIVGESYVIPSGTKAGKKLRQFSTNDLEAMLFQLDGMESKGGQIAEMIRNLHIVIDTRKRNERK
jgi:hypothetical protein